MFGSFLEKLKKHPILLACSILAMLWGGVFAFKNITGVNLIFWVNAVELETHKEDDVNRHKIVLAEIDSIAELLVQAKEDRRSIKYRNAKRDRMDIKRQFLQNQRDLRRTSDQATRRALEREKLLLEESLEENRRLQEKYKPQ